MFIFMFILSIFGGSFWGSAASAVRPLQYAFLGSSVNHWPVAENMATSRLLCVRTEACADEVDLQVDLRST